MKVGKIISDHSICDSKNIVNKLSKKVDSSILRQIESGITIEQLDKISKKLPIFKYRTQITIHGLFDELETNYVFGYKNIFQNKNKSIGIKYNAIDEEKRQRIYKRMKWLDFHYSRNSQKIFFQKSTRITKETFETVKKDYLNLVSKIDKNLFFGNYNLYVTESWGAYVIVLDIYINAIYEKNIEPFLTKLGATVEFCSQKEQEEKEYYEKLEKERNKKDELRKQMRLKQLEESDTSLLDKYPRKEKSTETGTYILRSFDYNDNLIFKVVYIYLPKGKKKPRYNKTEFKTIPEALSYIPEQNTWRDSIFKGRVTGWKIK